MIELDPPLLPGPSFLQNSIFTQDQFELAPAIRIDTASMKDLFILEIFALRYQVYCVECGFLPSTDYADQIETDKFDRSSIHFSALNVSDELTGCVRLVLADNDYFFPMDEKCTMFPNFSRPENSKSAEISRLVMKSSLRRRHNDDLQGMGRNTAVHPVQTTLQKTYTYNELLLLALYKAIFRYAKHNGIDFLYASMERSLARSLRRSGFLFTAIGPEVDYYGKVTPYILPVADLERDLGLKDLKLHQWMVLDRVILANGFNLSKHILL